MKTARELLEDRKIKDTLYQEGQWTKGGLSDLMYEHAKQVSIAFAEWLEKDTWWKSTDTRFQHTLGLWTRKINGDFKTEEGLTTEQLFKLFSEQSKG